MTTSVRFCLSHDSLKRDFIASPLKRTLVQCENELLTRTLSVTLRIRSKVLLHVRLYDYYDLTLSTDSNMTLMFSPLSVQETTPCENL